MQLTPEWQVKASTLILIMLVSAKFETNVEKTGCDTQEGSW